MTVQEAARQMLLDVDPSLGVVSEYDSDSDHVRIKFKRHEVLMSRENGSRQSHGSLDLRWLPGDLQSQVRSLVSSSLASHHYPSSELRPTATASSINKVRDLLRDMDERSTSDMPWWVVADTSDTEVSSEVSKNRAARAQMHEMVSSSSNSAGGYLIGALIAGVQKPLATAAVVMGVVALSFPLSTAVHFSMRQVNESVENEESSEPEDEEE